MNEDNYKINFEEVISKQLHDDNKSSNIEEVWNKLKKILSEASKEVLGERKRPDRREWYDNDCRMVVEKKNEIRKKMLQRETRATVDGYKSARKEATKLCRKKKKQWMEERVKKIEEYQAEGNIRQMYKSVRNLSTGYLPRLQVCKDKDGKLLSDQNECLERWAEHFQELYKSNTIDTVEEGQPQVIEIELERPSLEEVKRAILKLNNNKAPAEDLLPAEAFKNGGEALWKRVHQIVCTIWDQEEIPSSWKHGIIFPVHKKGDKMDRKNYRGITLLNTGYKIFSNILYMRA